MGNFSRDTFDKLKHYVNVRMQQGVPLVDADWNEKDDIRKHELQLFLKWFVGNGVPKNNDGFRIVPRPGVENDFLIKGGENGQPGICLAEGWDVLNETDTAYTAQPLFDNSALAQGWGVTPLAALTLPGSGERTDLVYLDVWEREVNGAEDPEIVNPALSIETCVRMKREWVVRVAEGTTDLPSPVPGGHVFYPLATIVRTEGQPEILQEAIADRRTTGLAILSDAISIDNGNVGIGKTAGTEKLEVDGRIKDQTGYVMPAGAIVMWTGAGNDIPEGWLLCDGNNNTPDLRDRFIVGAGSAYNVGDNGGVDNVTLTADQMPVHGHTASQTSHGHSDGEFDRLLRYNGQNTQIGHDNATLENEPDIVHSAVMLEAQPEITVENTGGDQPHENRPPYYALCFIMKQ